MDDLWSNTTLSVAGAVGNPLKSVVEAWGKMKNTAKTNYITGHDPVNLLMASGTNRLWAAGYSIFVLTVFCTDNGGLSFEDVNF